MRILLRESKLKDLDRDKLIGLHHTGLSWLARTFDVPYPFDKLDLVLLPGFPYGGMEHAGAIFYREASLVFDHQPTVDEQVRRSTLIYHELSHQWFGNLVTMAYGFKLHSNALSSDIPSQLGGLDALASYFWLHGNALSSAIPTQLGNLDKM